MQEKLSLNSVAATLFEFSKNVDSTIAFSGGYKIRYQKQYMAHQLQNMYLIFWATVQLPFRSLLNYDLMLTQADKNCQQVPKQPLIWLVSSNYFGPIFVWISSPKSVFCHPPYFESDKKWKMTYDQQFISKNRAEPIKHRYNTEWVLSL